MTREEKIKRRILRQPKDFTFEELETLLYQLGFERDNKGKTSGSRVRFYHKDKHIQYLAHKPHPKNIIKEKALKDIVDFLTVNKLL
ncbi:MAG: type II toxin-antitoxin system HicA family toxin [Bacteroidales bacterium]|nr:type II toxin-antitoxin system HicA family toxin [Bacteroidales bacterium]